MIPAVIPQPKKTKVVRLDLPPLHPRQREFVDDPHRIVVAAAGTKTGKTFGLGIYLLRHAWNNYQSLNWWTAPTLRQAKIAFNLLGNWLPLNRVRKRSSAGEMMYELLRSDGRVHSRIEFRSADNPDSLRGEGVHACVVDEAGYWSRDSFVSVWTTLTRTRGKLRIISTPKGRNWFFEEWMKGKNPEKFPEYASYQLPTASNPFVPRIAIEEAEKNLPKDVFRQEYLAEFLEEGAGVFRNISGCANALWLDNPVKGREYVIGVDLAKKDDYSVFMIADRETKKVCHIDRFNEIAWQIQIDRLIRLAKRWNNASVLMDSTGVGDPIYDAVKSVYAHVEGYVIGTNAAKKALIQKLQLALEQGEIGYPKDDTLIHELNMYSYEITPSGNITYSAPEGYHDDCCVALALANWQLQAEPLVYRFTQRRGV